MSARVDARHVVFDRLRAWADGPTADTDMDGVARDVRSVLDVLTWVESREPDGDIDGVLWWEVPGLLDVHMDNTSPGNIPPRFVIGDTEVGLNSAIALRDALTSAIQAVRSQS